jgi:hypothetical protein
VSTERPAAEKLILAAAEAGDVAQLTELQPEERVVDAAFVRELCRDVDRVVVDPRGIRISGGRIRDVLDLRYMTVTCPVCFEGTVFEKGPVMDRIRIPALGFLGCELAGLSVRDAQIDYEFTARRSRVDGMVDLTGVRAGSVVCSGASITVADGVALSLDEAEVQGSVFLDEDEKSQMVFQATGGVWLPGARIKGRLQCGGAIENRGAVGDREAIALLLDGAEVAGGVFLIPSRREGSVPSRREGFRAVGAVRMIETRITGQLNCECAILESLTLENAPLENDDRIALLLDGAQVDGSVYLNGTFQAKGEVRMLGARITGALDCRGATIANKGGSALDLSRAEVAGGVYLDPNRDDQAFRATGEVRMEAARIKGPLSCRGATLERAGQDVLVLDKAEVGGVFLERVTWSKAFEVEWGKAFEASGEVRMQEAWITGPLRCRGAKLLNKGGIALSLERARIDGSFQFRDVTVRGNVNLRHARAATLEDDLPPTRARCGGRGGRAWLRRVRLRLRRPRRPVARLNSKTGGSWAGAEGLVLDGFVHEAGGGGSNWEVDARSEWLQRTTDPEPRAWSQLASVYRTQGRDGDAASTLIAMHNDSLRRRKLSELGWAGRFRWAGRWILRVTVGHGYRPWYALFWAALVIGAFAVVVWTASEHFEPAKQGVHGHPQPLLYATDVFLPIVDVFQSDWRATGWASWVTFVVVLLGWALTTLFVAGFTRIVRT